MAKGGKKAKAGKGKAKWVARHFRKLPSAKQFAKSRNQEKSKEITT
jgi:hypothetical protein